MWAGKQWGAMNIPRIGQEVIVDFLEGDPDQPIITGRVYNGINMPPYGLPAKATTSTLKSNSSKGGAGFNEIRLDDTKGTEQMFIHAERNEDIRVKLDTFEWIGNERHLIVKADQIEKVEGGNQHLTVNGDQKRQGRRHGLAEGRRRPERRNRRRPAPQGRQPAEHQGRRHDFGRCRHGFAAEGRHEVRRGRRHGECISRAA
jgi:uncharacterized protein involved in type VI secretion and phage assembly